MPIFFLAIQFSILLPRHCSTKSNQIEDEGSTNPDFAKQAAEEAAYEEGIKYKILRASLPFVKEHGWTVQTLQKGAETLGYPGVIHGLFPNKGGNLVDFFNKDCNKILAEKMKKDVEENKCEEPITFVRGAVEARLRMIVPYRETWPQAMSLQALPPNVPGALANLLTLVDDICYYAGDRSVDFYWYSRRIGLAAMYKATEIYLVQDKSHDNEETWRFLSRRLEELQMLQAKQMETEKMVNFSKDVLTSAFTTARNILNLNR